MAMVIGGVEHQPKGHIGHIDWSSVESSINLTDLVAMVIGGVEHQPNGPRGHGHRWSRAST